MEANLRRIVSLCPWVVGPQAGGQGCLGPSARTGRPRGDGQDPLWSFQREARGGVWAGWMPMAGAAERSSSQGLPGANGGTALPFFPKKPETHIF